MNNSEILEQLNDVVYGHEEAKKALIVAIGRSQLRNYQRYSLNLPKNDCISTMKLMIIGESGTGKTFLIQSLASILDFPLLVLDSTQLNPTGASGGIKLEDIKKLIYSTVQRQFDCTKMSEMQLLQLFNRTVVFVDEMDKLALKIHEQSNWNQHLQTSMLTTIESNEELSGITWIFSGAFTDLRARKRVVKEGIGFNKTKHEVIDKITDDDLVKEGLVTEFVGRMSYIVELDRFDEDDYRYILRSICMKKKYEELYMYGQFVDKLSDEEVERVVKIGKNSGQGVRAMTRELNRLYLDHEFNYNVKPTYLSITSDGED